jgi:CYTH domain-containing protein
MDKTYRNELRRVFLIQGLPEPLTAASSHLQIFDNYIENTRIRIRSVRVPQTKEWTWILQQRFPAENSAHWKIAEIYLNEHEHRVFEDFEGREIRKNRYFFDFNGRIMEIDVYLGKLWGLNLAKAVFETIEDLENFEIPSFAVMEVTNVEFFYGENLVEKSFADVQTEFARLSSENLILREKFDV